MSRAHRVRTHHWRQGRLEVKDAFFESIEEALNFANAVEGADNVKVYNHNEEILHSISATATTESYA